MALRALLRTVALAAFLGGATAAAGSASPVDKVVTLLNDLAKKIGEDGAAEQKIYDKFACWCEKTTATKAAAIENAKSSIETLTEKVLKLKGKTANYAADIAQLNKDIASNEDSQKSATAIRETEQKEYDGARNNLEQAITALEHAIKVLEGAGELLSTDRKVSSGSVSMKQAELISTAGSLRTVLSRARGDVSYAKGADRRLVEEFLRDPAAFYRKEAKPLSNLQVSGFGGDYSPGSTAIQGILKGMYDAMVSDLESKNAQEATSQKNYEELIDTKSSELTTLKSTLEKKSETLGEDTKDLADSKLERDETQKQLDADEAFFLDSKDTCKSKADNWAERTRLRTEEKAGVTKAIEILSSDEAKETFGKSTSMLLQSRGMGREARKHKNEAFQALARVARSHHSLKLASLAALVQTGTEAEFPEVIGAIDKMLAELRKEEMDDITLRDYCQAEEHKVEGEIEDLDHKMETIQGEIDRLEATKKEIQADIEDTEKDIQATEDAMAEALSQRMTESEEFKAALKDDLDAAALLGSAIDAMTQFYKDNKLPLGLVAKKQQQRRRGPEYDDSGAPPDTFEEPYGGRSSQGGGIVQILSYLKEDTENEIIAAKNEESKAQNQFEDQRSAATQVLLSLQAKLAALEKQEADTDSNKADNTVKKEGAKNVQEGKQKYRESLKPKCDWMKDAFETRRDARQQEMTGLLQAKASISGGGAGEEELEMLQKGKRGTASFRGTK